MFEELIGLCVVGLWWMAQVFLQGLLLSLGFLTALWLWF